MKLFITGVTGQLGHDVLIEAARRGHTVVGSGSRAIPASEEKMQGSGDDMKIIVTGIGGQLGHDCMNEMIQRGHEAVGSDIQATYGGVADGSAVTTAPYVQLDITDEKAVKEAVERIHPDAIIHCAAWTAVDAAEDPENREKVKAINADGTRYIAEAAKAVDAKMLYLSTDYVFDGQGTRPWQPDDKDYAPLNYYGETTLTSSEIPTKCNSN